MTRQNNPNDPRSSPAYLALGCFALVNGTAAWASADAADMDSASSVIIVTGERQGTTLQSPKAIAPLLDTPQTVTVIDAEALRQQNLLSLRDALSTLPGITFGAGEGGGGFGDNINLRGFAASSDITQDGVRDSAQYSRTDPFDLAAIEVYNGASSVLNGSGSVGGTINLVSKTPQERDQTVLGIGLGTDRYARATADINRTIGDSVAIRFNAMAHRNDVPGRDIEQLKRFGIAPSVTIGMNGPTRLTLAWFHQEDENTPQYGIPYFPQIGGLSPEIDRHAYYGYRNIDIQRINADQLTATLQHDLGDGAGLRVLGRYQDIRQYMLVSQPQGTFCFSATGTQPSGAACSSAATAATPSAPAAIPIAVREGYFLPTGRGVVRDSQNALYHMQADLTAKARILGMEHRFDLGASITHESFDLVNGSILRNADGSDPFDRTLASRHQPFVSIANPGAVLAGAGVPAGEFGSNVYTGPVNFIRTGANRGALDNRAIYLFDAVALGKYFELNGGLRYEHLSGRNRVRTFQPVSQLALTDLSTRNTETLFSYRAGLVFKPNARTSLYAAFGNSRTPSKASVNGACTADTCNVKPETAVNYEIGVKADVFVGLQLTAALFRNERSSYRVPSGDPGVPDQVLDGRSRVDGIALGAAGRVTRSLTVFANYTYLDSKTVQGVSDFCLANPATPACVTAIAAAPIAGSPLLNTPKHSGSLFATYGFPFGLQLGYGFTYQGSFVILNSPSGLVNGAFPKSSDYFVQRLFLSQEIRHGLMAQLNVQNLANTRYLTRIRNSLNGWATPGDARSAVLSLSWAF